MNLEQYCTRSSVKYTENHVHEPEQYFTRSSVKYTGGHVQEFKQNFTRSSVKYIQEPDLNSTVHDLVFNIQDSM